MSTTSLKLPDDLKARAMAAAKARGVTPHAFMLDAIREAATATEQRVSFIADATAAHATMRGTGMGYDADEVHKYIRDKIAGKSVRRPKAKSWRA
jgi:predicted transcriptional regulator